MITGLAREARVTVARDVYGRALQAERKALARLQAARRRYDACRRRAVAARVALRAHEAGA